MTVPPEHREFARQAELSLTVDPRPTFENLSKATGVPVDTLSTTPSSAGPQPAPKPSSRSNPRPSPT